MGISIPLLPFCSQVSLKASLFTLRVSINHSVLVILSRPCKTQGWLIQNLRRNLTELQRFAGQFESPRLPPFRVSPLGVVPKKTPGEYRLIQDLSFPKGSPVNDGISSGYTSTTDQAIQLKLIKKAGHGCFMAKIDIKNAFRIIPNRPEDYGLLGMQWWDFYYCDRCMPMVLSFSCLTFETFSTAVEWISHSTLSITYIIHFLDDFLLIAELTE